MKRTLFLLLISTLPIFASNPTTVTLSTTTTGAYICYTTDGSAPSGTASSCTNGTHYTAPISVSSTTTVKAIGYKANYTPTAVQSGTYTITSANAVDLLIDMHGGTNGAQPTTTTLGNSTYGTNPTWSISNMGSGLIYSAAGQPVLLGTPVTVSGTTYTGNGGLSLECTTTTNQYHCGVVEGTFANSTSVSIGYSVKWTCPNSVYECGALGGLSYNLGGDYSFAHVSAGFSNMGRIQLETSGGLSTQYYDFTSDTPGTIYRINIQQNRGPNATNKMIVCDSNNNFLAYMTAPGSSSAYDVNHFALGLSGEQPTTNGYTYNFFNVVLRMDGSFNASGPCF